MRTSAGLLMYRHRQGTVQVLLVHPGGPYFRKQDEGAWSIPKGEVDADEDLLDAARREFQEETGVTPHGPFLALGSVQQKGGKVVHAWAMEQDCDPAALVSNTFVLEWPPNSGEWVEFPEIDRAEFFDLETAKRKINPAQVELVENFSQREKDLR